MADPFQDVDSAGPEFIKSFADAMDVRQSGPAMEAIVAAYLAQLTFSPGCITVEVGSGAGAVARRIAQAAHPEHVIGIDPSEGFAAEARVRAAAHDNLRFEVASGTDLPFADASVDHVIQHTVLSHVTEPPALIAEAARVLKPGGTLIVCDADFAKATMGSFPHDPLDCCARLFEKGFVTDAHIVGKLRTLMDGAGFEVSSFDVVSRPVTSGSQMRVWVEVTTAQMVERGEIGAPLAAALLDEHDRRVAAGTFYGHQVFATAIARKG